MLESAQKSGLDLLKCAPGKVLAVVNAVVVGPGEEVVAGECIDENPRHDQTDEEQEACQSEVVFPLLRSFIVSALYNFVKHDHYSVLTKVSKLRRTFMPTRSPAVAPPKWAAYLTKIKMCVLCGPKQTNC